LNRTRNSTGPADRTPGGWGAEESGARTGPGLEATLALSQCSVTGDWPKLGVIVGAFNEFVIVQPRFPDPFCPFSRHRVHEGSSCRAARPARSFRI